MFNETLTYISTITQMLVAIFVAYTAWVFNRVSIRNATRQQHASMLREIDQLIINCPELYGIYDNHELSKEKNICPQDVVKREAFIFLMFNTYEIIYDYYTTIIIKNKVDKSYWNAWDISISNFFFDSTEARELFIRYKSQYSNNFSNYIMKIIQNIPNAACKEISV